MDRMTAYHNVARRGLTTLLAVSCVLAAAGCSASSGPATSQSDERSPMAASETARPATFSNDGAFVDEMIRQTQLNMRLAELQLSNGYRPVVLEMAEKVQKQDGATLQFLLAERARIGINGPAPSLENDPHAVSDQRRMTAGSREDVDAFFVEHMIKHSLEMAKFAAANNELASPNLQYFSESVPEDCSRRLRELRAIQTIESNVPVNARAGKRGVYSSPPR